jgi:hypothetical protein
MLTVAPMALRLDMVEHEGRQEGCDSALRQGGNYSYGLQMSGYAATWL